MGLLFQPFIQCFVELSKILFNYSIPIFDVPLYVFVVLPLIFKVLLIPISASGSNLRSTGDGVVTYLKSRGYEKSKQNSNMKGGE